MSRPTEPWFCDVHRIWTTSTCPCCQYAFMALAVNEEASW